MNFDKEKFSKILINIKDSYGSINQMAEQTGVTSAYISKLIRLKYDNAPSPNILKKIADNSNGVTTYAELMNICGYIESNDIVLDTFSSIVLNLLNKNRVRMLLNNFSYFCNYSVKSYLNYLNGNLIHEKKRLKNFTDFDLYSEFFKLHNLLVNILIDKGLIKQTIFQTNKKLDFVNNADSNLLLPQNHKYDFVELNDTIIIQYNNIAQQLLQKLYSLYDNYYNSNIKEPQIQMCPVYGRIAAGQPNWAEECIEGYLPIDPVLMNIANPDECYFLRVNGESMNKLIKNGAFALIRKTDWVENGEVAVVLVNGFDATLKKFTKQGNLIVLEPMSNDPSFQTQVYDKNTQIKVIGKYIGKMEMN